MRKLIISLATAAAITAAAAPAIAQAAPAQVAAATATGNVFSHPNPGGCTGCHNHA